jgi:hypothetical protein
MSTSLIDLARDRHGNEELQIDEDAVISEADDGAWVAAWVWIPYPPGWFEKEEKKVDPLT